MVQNNFTYLNFRQLSPFHQFNHLNCFHLSFHSDLIFAEFGNDSHSFVLRSKAIALLYYLIKIFSLSGYFHSNLAILGLGSH